MAKKKSKPKTKYQSVLAGAQYSKTKLYVSRPVKIATEWRVVVKGSEIVCSSQYMSGGRVDIKTGAPADVDSFVTEIFQSSKWTPDPMFVADIALTDDGFKLIEINSLSCSGWYSCDARKIVDAVSALALNYAG